MGFPHTSHWEGRHGQGHRLKAVRCPWQRASPCPLGYCLLLLIFGPNRGTVKKRAEEVSAMEQHYHQLLCAARSPLGANVATRPHPTHSSFCVGQSFVTLPSFGCRQTPAIPLSLTARPRQSVAGEKKSGILYVHIYLPAAGLLQLAGFPPAPKSSSFLLPGQGQWEGGKRWLAEGGCKMGRPHQTRGRRRASFSTC